MKFSIRCQILIIIITLIVMSTFFIGYTTHLVYQEDVEGVVSEKLGSITEHWQIIINSYHEQCENSNRSEAEIMEEVKALIEAESIGETGYIFVLDSAGNYIASKDGLRDGENIWNVFNDEGISPAQEIIKIAHAAEPYDINYFSYTWKNIGEDRPLPKMAAITYIPEWDWVLGTTAYYKDFLTGSKKINNNITIVGMFSIIFVSFFALFFSNRFIIKPIRELEKMAIKAAKGDLLVRVSHKTKEIPGEIGILAQSFEKMIINLNTTYNKLETLSQNLEKTVERRTKQLRLANKKMQDTLEAKTNFLNQVAHDLRTPLTPIKLLVESILKKPVAKKVKDKLIIVERNVKSLNYLVTDVLNLVRLDSNRNKVNLEKVDLKEFLEEIIENNMPVFKENKIKIVKKIQPNLTVSIDKNKISEVIGNLISNSIKYMGNGTKLIEFTTYKNHTKVVVQVRDTGRGIDPKNSEFIFEEFFKEDQYHGGNSIGLGLAICKKIINLHKGKIWANSQGIGKGLTISLTLPLSRGKKK